MRKFLIERQIPGVENLDSCGLAEAARKSNGALADLAPRVQWIESYVVDGGTVCVYLAEDERAIRDHAEKSGFPANEITEVRRVIDPTTALG
jgi:Nickel responsive protein SCO4226-like